MPIATVISPLPLGVVSYADVGESLEKLPLPPISIGSTALINGLLFLPERAPRCVAWQLKWYDRAVLDYRSTLTSFLTEEGLYKEGFPNFLPHVTLCRAPFSRNEWKAAFKPLPAFTGSLHLYESLGNSRYRICWTHRLLPPFEETKKGFIIRGHTFSDLYTNAMGAFAFSDPSILINYGPQAPADYGELTALISRNGTLKEEDDYYAWEIL